MAVNDCQASTDSRVVPGLAIVDFIYNTSLLLFDKMSRDQGERQQLEASAVDTCSLFYGGFNHVKLGRKQLR